MNLFDDKLVSIDQNISYLLKIRKWSQQEEDSKASPRSAIADLADKNVTVSVCRNKACMTTIEDIFDRFSIISDILIDETDLN